MQSRAPILSAQTPTGASPLDPAVIQTPSTLFSQPLTPGDATGSHATDLGLYVPVIHLQTTDYKV